MRIPHPTPPVTYRVRPADPAAHLFEVTLEVPRPPAGGTTLRLPAWIPGSYTIREFARNIVAIAAHCGGRPVPLAKRDKDTWQVDACEGPLVVTAVVYAYETTVRTAYLDPERGFFNGTSLFLAVEGLEDQPHAVVIEPPEGEGFADWRCATTLPRDDDGGLYDFGRFLAADHDALIDHPVELGRFTDLRFEAGGVAHDVVISGAHRVDGERLCRDLTAICEAQQAVFDGDLPVDRYLFLVFAVGQGYGGLEHRSSTALICKRADLPLPGVEGVTPGYRQFLGLCSHEYFHTWNVKRIKPARFVPYDLSTESHTTLLWAFEGITSYYDDLGLLRSERIDRDSYLELLGRTATRVYRGSGRFRQSVSDSSFDAWTKFYKQDENAPNAIVSYYAKGALVALCLDLHLRRVTDEAVGLDTVMKTLWARHGDGSGVPEDGVEAVASELAGVDLTPFFDLAVRGTCDLPLDVLLGWVGVHVGFRPSQGDGDKGGSAPKASDTRLAEPGDLGVTVRSTALGARLAHVHHGGAAHAAGLSAKDVVVAVDGLRVTGKDLTDRIRSRPAGTTVTVHAFRRDVLRAFEVTLQAPEASTVWLSLDEAADDEVVARRERWLAGTLRPASA